MADAFAGAAAMAKARTANRAIQITLPEVPVWVPAWAQEELNAIVRSTLRLALTEVAAEVSQAASDLGVVDSGHLAQSFGADPANRDGGIQLLGVNVQQGIFHGRVFSSLPYAIVMEEGRRPGAPVSREGIDAIGLWAQRKLGLSAEQADDAKWAIAQSIVANGIEGRFYAERGFDQAKPRVETMFMAMGQAMGRILTTKKGGTRQTYRKGDLGL